MPKYRIHQVRLPFGHPDTALNRKVCRILGISPKALKSCTIQRRSLDARDPHSVMVIYGVVAETAHPLPSSPHQTAWSSYEESPGYRFPSPLTLAAAVRNRDKRPVIVGAGPAGLFCALLLAEQGFAPLVLERGDDVDTRKRAVDSFWETGILDPESNMQFGEGGAGTFSDGKLNTTVKDPDMIQRRILDEFIEAGADPEIGIINKPHIGTDILVTVVKNLRRKIERLGGEIRFGSRVTGFDIIGESIQGVRVGSGESIPSDRVILAIGHSSRDTYEILTGTPVTMIQKPFAIGVRVEHPQELIQRSQFGASWCTPGIPRADYKLTFQSSQGRGVYSFCMCPGGFVVNASSEPGGLVCNGMSNFARESDHANSAIVVTVHPGDFGGDHVLAGVEFQRHWERKAYELTRIQRTFALPVQRFGDFMQGVVSSSVPSSLHDTKGAVVPADLHLCLPDFVTSAIKEGMMAFDRRIQGFAAPDTLLTGVETRTSAPVRILRDETYQSNVRGFFPCGEGSGYAGGIMSSAMDGIRTAEAVVRSLYQR